MGSSFRVLDGVAVDANADVFYTDYWNAVYEPPSGSSSPIRLTTSEKTHYCLALDSEDDVFYTDNLGGGVWEVPLSQSETTTMVTVATINDFPQLVQAFENLSTRYSQLAASFSQLSNSQQSLASSYASQAQSYATLA